MKAQVSSRARSARKFQKKTLSPSPMVASGAAVGAGDDGRLDELVGDAGGVGGGDGGHGVGGA